MRRAAKRDANERAIIKTWEALGAYVEVVSGPGLADTLVHYRGELFRAEVKGAKRGLTKRQVENFKSAYEAGVFTYILRSPDDAYVLLREQYLDAHRSLLVWTPAHGALAGAERKERAFRPGTDKARTVEELCARDGCGRSKSPGLGECAPHAAETFAPPDAFSMIPIVQKTREELSEIYPERTRKTRGGTP